jgi:hypothetical protein
MSAVPARRASVPSTSREGIGAPFRLPRPAPRRCGRRARVPGVAGGPAGDRGSRRWPAGSPSSRRRSRSAGIGLPRPRQVVLHPVHEGEVRVPGNGGKGHQAGQHLRGTRGRVHREVSCRWRGWVKAPGGSRGWGGREEGDRHQHRKVDQEPQDPLVDLPGAEPGVQEEEEGDGGSRHEPRQDPGRGGPAPVHGGHDGRSELGDDPVRGEEEDHQGLVLVQGEDVGHRPGHHHQDPHEEALGRLRMGRKGRTPSSTATEAVAWRRASPVDMEAERAPAQKSPTTRTGRSTERIRWGRMKSGWARAST